MKPIQLHLIVESTDCEVKGGKTSFFYIFAQCN